MCLPWRESDRSGVTPERKVQAAEGKGGPVKSGHPSAETGGLVFLVINGQETCVEMTACESNRDEFCSFLKKERR